LDPQTQLIIAQAYYKAGDYAGCVRYIQENFNPPMNQTAALLLERCQKS
jgi:hypothetical protein